MERPITIIQLAKCITGTRNFAIPFSWINDSYSKEFSELSKDILDNYGDKRSIKKMMKKHIEGFVYPLYTKVKKKDYDTFMEKLHIYYNHKDNTRNIEKLQSLSDELKSLFNSSSYIQVK